MVLAIFYLNLFLAPLAHAVDILGALDEDMAVASTETQRIQGKHKIWGMLIECEFQESCVLQIIGKLNILYQVDHNPIYHAFGEYLYSKRTELAKNALECNLQEKQMVRKAYGECLTARMLEEDKIQPLDRAKIDQLNDAQDVCVKNKMEPLAKEGNIFAEALLVNFGEQARNQKDLNFWYNKMEQQSNTEKFKAYLRCTDIP